MATTNPILRIRRALRSVGASADQADEFASAIDEIYVSRQQFEDRIARMLADHRRQLLVEVVVIVSIAVGIILGVLA